ncbi:uncharacterized protein SCDLUD_001568 [Saccharomycodes ludwigii]|uniref:gag-pol fusion protein n=1 Tax=Saccharomycodes ludwigii TaxID=36035 RepID=UPI001E857F03|nr:hypothetical protein SCDLUD_004288 [Saccharomycodes ludwigii]XP_045935722.1 hypothetical protein SCDLUD_001568 [Saccharomycodes ludwigii]KAH3899972.1 hypothetical protein SCDLUD_004288 [Saccharomycodes ludwigii]KAH3901789.1 hypothetical protein SCDLUD_001568 [Saccharomycodes ludwigii]
MSEESNIEVPAEQRNNPTSGNNPNNELFQHGANSSSANTPANTEETFNQQTPEPSTNNTRVVVESPFSANTTNRSLIYVPDHLLEAVKTLIKNDAAPNRSNNDTTNQIIESNTIVPMGVPKNKLKLPRGPPNTDFITLADNTDFTRSNKLACASWASLNSHNAKNYKIPWNNFPTTYYESARFNSNTWKRFISQLTPMPYPVSSLSEIVQFIKWYNNFTYRTHENGIHQLLFYTVFSKIKNSSPIDEAENREILNNILPKIFPHKMKDISDNTCSSTIFRDYIEEVFPAHPSTIAVKLLDKYVITNNTTTSDMQTQINTAQSFRYCAKMDAIPDKEIIPYFERKISDCYGESTAHLIRKWMKTPNLTMQELLADLHEYMKISKRYKVSTNPRTDSFLPRKFQINNINRYDNTRYPKRRYNNGYPNRNRNYSRNNHPKSRNYTNHQSHRTTTGNNTTNQSNINNINQNNTNSNPPQSRLADFQPFFPNNSNINCIPQLATTKCPHILIDGGAHSSITNDKQAVTNFIPTSEPLITSANNTPFNIIGTGTIELNLNNYHIAIPVYVAEDDLPYPYIISEYDLRQQNIYKHNTPSDTYLASYTHNFKEIKLTPHARVHVLDKSHIEHNTYSEQLPPNEKPLSAHSICAHFSSKKIKELLQTTRPSVQNLLPRTYNEKILKTLSDKQQCSLCLQAKIHKINNKKEFLANASQPLEIISIDYMELGKQQYLCLIDHYTRYLWMLYTKDKQQTAVHLQNFIQKEINNVPFQIQTIFSDNALEFKSTSVVNLLSSYGIKQKFSPSYQPAINGICERSHRTILNAARAIYLETKCPIEVFPYLIQYCVQWYNLVPHSHTKKTPTESLYGIVRITKALFHPFGCKVIYYSHRQSLKHKLETNSAIGIYLGFNQNQTFAYYVLDLHSQTVAETNTVYFLDHIIGFQELAATAEKHREILQLLKEPTTIKTIATISKPTTSIPTSPSLSEAGKYNEWKNAIINELQNHKSFNTFEIVSTPSKAKLLPTKWVFTVKRDREGNISKYKARLTACGNRDIPLDPVDTTSPTTDITLLKLLLAFCVQYNWHTLTADVKSAYLHANINRDTYLRIPKYLELHYNIPKSQQHQCLKLNRSLYGLSDSGRNWFKYIYNTLTNLNYHPFKSCDTIFYKTIGKIFIIILLYVDDLLIITPNSMASDTAIKEISRTDITIGSVSHLQKFLGLNFEKQKEKLFLWSTYNKHQWLTTPKYTNNPSPSTYITNKDIDQYQNDESTLRSIVGQLNYVALSTRPDLTYATHYLSKTITLKTSHIWKWAQKALSYYHTTKDQRLYYRPTTPSEWKFTIYADSDHGSDPITRKSTSGFIAFIGNCPIYWRTQKSSRIITSSTASELYSLKQAIDSTKWIQNTANEIATITNTKTFPTRTIHQDNTSTINAMSAEFFRYKQWDIIYRYINEMVKMGEIILKYHPTEDLMADALTKPIDSQKFSHHIRNMQIS